MLKKYRVKYYIKLLIKISLVIYVIYLFAVAFFARDLLLIRSKINNSNIIFEYDVKQKGSKFGTTFLIYLKDSELGFIKTEPINANIFFPFIPIKVTGYSLSKYYSVNKIKTDTGETIVTDYNGKQYYTDKNAKTDDIQLRGHYFYFYVSLIRIKSVYMGVKDNNHFSIDEDKMDIKFEYFLPEDILDGKYVYLFESEEQDLHSDYTFIR